jgi:hypothetical protein
MSANCHRHVTHPYNCADTSNCAARNQSHGLSWLLTLQAKQIIACVFAAFANEFRRRVDSYYSAKNQVRKRVLRMTDFTNNCRDTQECLQFSKEIAPVTLHNSGSGAMQFPMNEAA